MLWNKIIVVNFIFLVGNVFAHKIKVTDEQGKPLHGVMATQVVQSEKERDTTDGGYQKAGIPVFTPPEITRFTDPKGMVEFEPREKITYRFRLFGYEDFVINLDQVMAMPKEIQLKKLTDLNEIAAQKPANIWLGALEIGSEEDKNIFKMQCGFCHQQGNVYIREQRDADEWSDIIKRMIRYGSRLPSDLQKKLPETLSENYPKLTANPGLLAEPKPLDQDIERVEIKEWPVGDSMSQTHDMLVASGYIYVADNIQDRLYELDPKTNNITVYKIPHYESDVNGGLIAARLEEFPRHDSTSNAHSLAESKVDGHLFITPSAQRRLIEFDPKSKKFWIYEMEDGFYPHTIRIDQQDRVWFTLALSNQVAMFDRQTKKFKYYNLPARSFKEKLITGNIRFIFKLMSWGVPLSNWLSIDRVSSGVPLPYGIDITPDGKVWIARLHTKEIGVIDPKSDAITMIPTPFMGPRRLRTDGDGNLWIVSFGESKLAKYDPKNKKFTMYDLPVVPVGSETPYSVNVDLVKKVVWVTGNQSDALYGLDIESEIWRTIPLPRRTTFTRDVEFDEHNGTFYTANSNFPSWHVEDEQPTLIQVKIR